MGASQTRRQPRQVEYDVEDEEQFYVTRPRSSARRYGPPPERDTLDDVSPEQGMFIQRRRASSMSGASNGTISKAVAPQVSTRIWHGSRRFPLLAIITGMLLMALLAFGLSAFGSWWQIHQDDVTYGRPRTFQTDVVVGHGDDAAHPSHFICVNLNRHIVITEIPGGDTSRAIIYSGPTLFGDGQDLTPATLEFRDVNGDGKPDMIVHIQDQRIVFINDGTKFRALQPGENVNL